MRMKVVTTITSELVFLDDGGFDSSHSVDIDDQDGLSEVSREVLGALITGGLKSTERAVRAELPTLKALVEEEGD